MTEMIEMAQAGLKGWTTEMIKAAYEGMKGIADQAPMVQALYVAAGLELISRGEQI